MDRRAALVTALLGVLVALMGMGLCWPNDPAQPPASLRISGELANDRDLDELMVSTRVYEPAIMPATARDETTPTGHFSEPRAMVRVRARNLPSAPGNRYAISARLGTGAMIHRGGPGHEPSRGEIIAEFEVPPGVPCTAFLLRTNRSDDDLTGFAKIHSDPITLAPGEHREVTLDLDAFGALAGRVSGLATIALKGQVVSLQSGTIQTEAVLDPSGAFRMVGLANSPLSLTLRTQGGLWPALQEVGRARRQWRAAEVGYLDLEPETPVYGVIPVQGGRYLQPFGLQANTPPRPQDLSDAIPLFTGQILDRVPLHFFVPGIGRFMRSLADVPPDADGVYRVEVPTPGGSLLVRVVHQPSEGLVLFARPVVKALHATSFTGRGEGSMWRFDGLAAGKYRLVADYSAQRSQGSIHCERTLPETYTVQSRRETVATVEMPELLEIHGEIANWRDIPDSLEPEWLQLNYGGRPHTVHPNGNGTFELTVLGPWDGISKVSFFNDEFLTSLSTTDITWLPRSNRLSVQFPSDLRKHWVQAEPIADGVLSIQTYPCESNAASHSQLNGRGRLLRPLRDHRFLIATTPITVDGVLLERIQDGGQNLRLLRGWFRMHRGGPNQIRLALSGHWVQIARIGANAATKITLQAPSWWQHPAHPGTSIRLEGDLQRFWLPDSATAVLVNKMEIPVSEIGERLVIE